MRAPDPNGGRRVLEVVAAPGPPGPGGRLFLDPERAQECIDRLRSVVTRLSALTSTLEYDLTFEAPGSDPVSLNAADQGAVMARRATAFVTAWRNQIELTVVNLETQLASYQGVEEENRDRFV